MVTSRSMDTPDTQLMSEALYGMYLLHHRKSDLQASKVRRGSEADSLSTTASSEDSEVEVANHSEESCPMGPPPGLDAVMTKVMPPPGLEEVESIEPMSVETAGGMAVGPMAWTATLPLSSHLWGLLSSRRGKQRLRFVGQQSGAQLMLDEHWQVLYLAGACHSIYKAQEALEMMEGFTVEIASAMWSELMRCRREEEDTYSPLTLSKVQDIVGYRVHVERDSLALRIFGPKNMELSVAILIKRLEELCAKEVLKLPEECDWNELKEIQKSGNVTLRVEGGYIELEGIQSAVLQTKEELCKRLKGIEIQDSKMSRRAGLLSRP